MPVLAIPYVVPFATYAGIAIGGAATVLGLKALSDKVQDYMAEFPEESMKILAMIMPEQGIAALFNKEAGNEVEVEGEEVEEDLTKLSGKEKGKRMKEEAQKKKGSYQDPEATGSYASKRGRIIRRLKEEGKITDKPDPDYDPDKPKFNWKRFTRKKADGGRVGFKKGGKGRQDPMGGHAHQTAAEMRAAAPDQFGGGMNISHGGGDGDKGPIQKLNISPAIETKYSDLGFNFPTGKVGLTSLSDLGKIRAMIDFRNLIEGEDLESEITYENQFGPTFIGGKFDTEGNKQLGLGFNKGNLSIGAYTDLDDLNQIGLRYQKTFKDGGLATMFKRKR